MLAIWVKYLLLYFPANTINLKCVTYNLWKSNLSREFRRVYKPFAKKRSTSLGKRNRSTSEFSENIQKITWSGEHEINGKDEIKQSYKHPNSNDKIFFTKFFRWMTVLDIYKKLHNLSRFIWRHVWLSLFMFMFSRLKTLG